jgi:hypothetical protein
VVTSTKRDEVREVESRADLPEEDDEPELVFYCLLARCGRSARSLEPRTLPKPPITARGVSPRQ